MTPSGMSDRANLIIVSSLCGALVLLIAGAFGCIMMHLTLPEYLNNATTLVAGGLIGYLGSHRQAQTSSSVGSASTVNVTPADPPQETPA